MAEISSLILRVTETCNLRCTYCYASRGQQGHMTEETALASVALCCPPGGSLRVQFTGGEPLLNLELLEAVHAFGLATGRRLRLAVQTNGTLLTPAVCRRLRAMGCAVGVSLDGLLPANGCRLLPDGSPAFPAAVQGIRTLGQAGLRCNLTTVVTCVNARDLGQLPDLALWLGNVSGVGLDLFRPLGRGSGADLLPGEEDLTAGLTELVRKTRELQKAGIPFRLRELERLKKRAAWGGCGPYCYAQTDQSLCVDKNGDCWPCSSLAGDPAYHLGNIGGGALSPPLSAPPSLDAPESCRTCVSLPLCGGGCPAGRSARDPARDHLTCVMHHILLREAGGIDHL